MFPILFHFWRSPFGLGLQSPALDKEKLLFDRVLMSSSTASEKPKSTKKETIEFKGPKKSNTQVSCLHKLPRGHPGLECNHQPSTKKYLYVTDFDMFFRCYGGVEIHKNISGSRVRVRFRVRPGLWCTKTKLKYMAISMDMVLDR